jgi:hypothetical protein
MSTAAVIAGLKTAESVGKVVVKATKAGLKASRKAIACKELEDAKDYDNNGRIGSVGGRKRVQRRRSGKTGSQGRRA